MSALAELRLTNVTKRFGGVVAVSDVSILLTSGLVTGLIGPNGAGKSTLIGLICGFLRPDSGGIALGDHDLMKCSPTAIARLGVSRTFQHAAPLAGLSVLDNVMAGLHTRHRASLGSVLLRLPRMRRESLAMRQVAEELLDKFGLAQEAYMDAGELTFGKLRFLEVARAVAMQPKVILLDEPAAGLNHVETERLAEIIRTLRADGITTLLVDHDVPFVFSLSDQLVVMNFGSVIATGAAEEVYGDPLVREAYLGNEN